MHLCGMLRIEQDEHGQPNIYVLICDALRDLVPFLQFKKREKYPWRSVTFSKFEG